MNSSGSVSGGRLPLAFLPEGAEGIVLEVRGGQGVTRHLEDMGFASPARVKVLKSCPPGAMLVMVKDSRIALGRGMAMKILVRSIEEP
ncbi:MAG: ferrous iron transport protein A [Methanothrix sp.]|nr:ferrous iron transport protein A [Methanothrix sp.]